MSSAASLLQGRDSGSATALADRLPLDVLKRRVGHRRHMLAVQVASYGLGATVLLVYAHAGTIAMSIPSAFFVCGVTLIGIFAILSETHVNDRYQDHYLTVFQVGGHVAIQLGFMLIAPEIGYAFLNVLFLIFGVAALRMTPHQAAIVWALSAISITPIFLLTRVPIGMPVAPGTERFAAVSICPGAVDQFLRLISLPAVVAAFLIASQVSGAGIFRTSPAQTANQ
jgi:hypothetical protein